MVGMAESDRDMFLRHLRIRFEHDDTVDEALIEEFRPIIYGNIIQGMQMLVMALNLHNVPWSDPGNEQYAALIMDCDRDAKLASEKFRKYVGPCRALWSDSSVQSIFEDVAAFGLDYVPSKGDILHCNRPEDGARELVVSSTYTHSRLHITDVGGMSVAQPRVRQIFYDVECIIFFVSAQAFDPVPSANGISIPLLDACDLFDAVINDAYLRSVPILLVFTKLDALEEKIKCRSIKESFPNFKGKPQDIKDVKKFIAGLFLERSHKRKELPFHSFVTLTSADDANDLFSRVETNVVMKRHQKHSLFMGYHRL
ncbi:guanine nucleotide-binding protein subunit alpha-13-like [Diadema setosum]|uniref:guanine nucleotide-binding protein subunit alpha-13-like n=1 Tax=Diadema setosum TaxID=31175 RepID=UPI003B3A34D8